MSRVFFIKLFLVVVILLKCGLAISADIGFSKIQTNQVVATSGDLEQIDSNLWQIYLSEINGLSSDQISDLNSQTIVGIQEQSINIDVSSKRVSMVPAQELGSILNFTKNHPLFGIQREEYERQGTSLGYCFGRATFLHLLFLRLGLQKESIEKVWVLGHIKNDRGDGYWQFHVATMVYSDQREWIVMDATIDQDWYKHYFVDMMSYLKNTSLTQMGLSHF